MKIYHIAILGAGSIAHAMAKTLRGMKEQGRPVELWAIAARELGRAQQFASEEGFLHAYGSYEEMLADPEVDLVYIATPHSHHAEHIELCVNAGKAVLCEKSFTGNAKQAERVLALAEEKGVLVTEAIWTRYMPSRTIINEIIASGEIGRVLSVTANLGYNIPNKERMLKPELAGGALLDLGVYTLNFASMVLGDDVVRTESIVDMTDSGVDRSETIVQYYRGGQSATLTSHFMCRMDRHGCIYGEKAYMIVDNINNPHTMDIYDDNDDHLIRHIDFPQQITGYEYQVEACLRALEAGQIECPEMPHAQTIHMMQVMDALRADWHMVYPFD